MPRWLSLLFFILLLLFPTQGEAQTHRMVFSGQTLDRETRAPIKGVNITIAGMKRGAVSDEEGSFSLILYDAPVYLNVSHVGYESQRIWIEESTPFITVLLGKSVTPLEEVEIRSHSEPVPFFKDNQYAVLDYEVDSGCVWMIIYRFRRNNSELVCKTLQGETLACSGVLPVKPTELFRDCLGSMHLLSSDSAWQIEKEGERLHLLYPVSLSRLKASLGLCVASSDSLLFVREVSRDGMVVIFSAVDKRSSKVSHLQVASDQEKMRLLRDQPYDRYLLMLDTIPDDHETAAYMHWLKKVVFRPNTSSLHKIGNLMGIFNTTDYTLSLYTPSGALTTRLKLPIEQIKDGKWSNEIYIDDLRDKAYTSFRKGGLFTLFRIDLNTGDLKRQLTALHPFPRKFRVHNNWLFYLYDIPGSGDNKHIYKQKL